MMTTKILIGIVILMCVGTNQARKKYWSHRENEIIEKKNLEVVVKVPKVSPIATGRRIPINVIPMEESCTSQKIKDEHKLLRSQVKCEPRPTVVYLQSETGSTLMPNAVLVNRCAGMCSGTHKCIATEMHSKIYYIKNIVKNKVSCTSVIVPEDTDCKCECQQRATDCTRYQEYDKSTCLCVCKNTNDRDKCLERKNKQWKWDHKDCICRCTPKSCSTGTAWSQKHCRCKMISGS